MSRIYPPFLKEAQKGKGCSPMSDGAITDYAHAVGLETSGCAPSMDELRDVKVLIIEIILKRIEVLSLPIKFTTTGLLGAYAFTENNPGKAMILLIDCLTIYEGKTITAEMLADIYPFGFYSEDTTNSYVDDYFKNLEVRPYVKWAEIY